MSIFVQGTENFLVSGSSITATFSSSNTAGNTIVVIFRNVTNVADLSTIHDSQGNSYNIISTASGSIMQFVAFATNIAGGANTVTCTPSATAEMEIILAEYKGAWRLDVLGTNHGFGTAVSSGTITTTKNDYVVMAVTGTAGNNTISGQTAGYNIDIQVAQFLGLLSNPTLQITGNYSASCTIAGGSQNWSTALIGFSSLMSLSFIQGNHSNPGTVSTSFTASYPSNNGGGNALAIALRWGATVTVLSVTDSQGNSWVAAAAAGLDANGTRYQLWYALNSKPGANTITVTFSATSSFVWAAWGEWSGIGISVDVVFAFGTGTGTSLTTGSNTTTATDAFIFLAGTLSGETYTGAGTFVVEEQGAGVCIGDSGSAFLSAGSYTPNVCTIGASDTWGTIAVAFKQGSGSNASTTISGADQIIQALQSLQKLNL